MKRVLRLVPVILSIFIFVSCTSSKKENLQIEMIYPDGLPAIAMSKFINDNKYIDNVEITYNIQKTTDALLSELVKENGDMIVVPSNLALKAVEKNLSYKIAGTIGWGSLYLVSTNDLSNINNLESIEIYNTGKGLTPDIITRKVLEEKGLEVDKLNFSYVNSASELAPLIIGNKATTAIVPEPILSTILNKKSDLKVFMNLNEEWANIYNSKLGYPQSTLLIKEDLFNKLKNDGRLDNILKEIKYDVDWVKENPIEAGDVCESIGITVNKNILDKAINNANINFVPYNEEQQAYDIYFKAIDDRVQYESLFE